MSTAVLTLQYAVLLVARSTLATRQEACPRIFVYVVNNGR